MIYTFKDVDGDRIEVETGLNGTVTLCLEDPEGLPDYDFLCADLPPAEARKLAAALIATADQVAPEYGTEFCVTIWGSATGPRYGE